MNAGSRPDSSARARSRATCCSSRSGSAGGSPTVGLVAADGLGDLEALGQQVDEGGVDVVDAGAVGVELAGPTSQDLLPYISPSGSESSSMRSPSGPRKYIDTPSTSWCSMPAASRRSLEHLPLRRLDADGEVVVAAEHLARTARRRARGSRRRPARCRRRCRRRSASSRGSRGSRTARSAGSRGGPGRSRSSARTSARCGPCGGRRGPCAPAAAAFGSDVAGPQVLPLGGAVDRRLGHARSVGAAPSRRSRPVRRPAQVGPRLGDHAG